MKEFKIVSAILTFFAIMIMPTGIISAQDSYIAKTEDISNIQIDKEDVSAYFATKHMKVNVQNMMIASEKSSYFLIVDDKSSDWIYVLELKNRNSKLYIKKNQAINACESGKLSLDVINFIDGQFKGCVDCNHKIVKI